MAKSVKNQKQKIILDFIREHSDRPMKIKEMAKKIGISNNDYPEFRRVVKKLIDDGKLVKLKRGRIGLPDQMNLVTGPLAMTKAGFGFVKHDNRDEEVFIPTYGLANALDGDRVLVRLKPGFGFKGKREGTVIKIIERRRTKVVGTYHTARRFGHVVPDDRKINRDIYIAQGFDNGASDGEKVVVELDSWDDPNLNPEGTIIERLGVPGDPGVDMLSIIRAYELPTEFNKKVLDEAEKVAHGWSEEFKKRVNLLDLTLFTIDPADARDHDDAVSIEMRDGKYRLGVHIADVSHFVTENSELDKEAFARGTSVYFPDRVIPMLPEQLSNDVCSLRPNRKRLAFSLMMDIDKAGKVTDYQLFPSVIKSAAKLSYEDVQEFFDNGVGNKRTERIADDLNKMRELARILYRRRYDAGSLDFDLPEAKITLDPQGNVIEIGNRVRLESHRLIEEFMLAANRQVAQHFLRYSQPTLYRIHDRPDLEKLEAFAHLISKFGYKFSVSPEMPPRDFSRLLEKVKGKPEEGFINELMLRSMKKAIYQPDNIGHFGLAFKHYLHFTSPIRRYPDLIVHRMLKLMKNGKYPVKVAQRLQKILPNVGKQSSEMERRAMEAEREAVKAKQVAYMAHEIGSEYDGVISGVINYGFFVRLIGPECEGFVRASSIDDDYYGYDEENYRMTGRRGGRAFRLGDKVRVGVMSVDVESRQINLFLLETEKKQPDKRKHKGARKRKR